MLGSSPVHRSAETANRADPHPFLGSHRALAVRMREFERLTEAAVGGVAALHASGTEAGEEPHVRRSPDRCAVQFGPVALTVAWLRRTLDSAAEGELLVIVWRGVVTPGGRYVPDQTTTLCTPVRSATVLWEEVLRAVADDEPSWRWRPAGADIGGYRSTELAQRCVERLRVARAHGADDVGSACGTSRADAASSIRALPRHAALGRATSL